MAETRTTRLPLMAPKQILVVEDEKPIRDMISFGLRRAGFDVREAADCRAARAQLADKRPDLMLVDWMLPDMSGLEFTRQVKRDSNLRDMPVIILTARGQLGDRLAGLNSGADDYLVKPFEVRELEARISTLLRRHRRAVAREIYTVGDLTLDTGRCGSRAVARRSRSRRSDSSCSRC